MTQAPSLNRTINRLPAVLLVISAIVGSGIFKKIAPMSAGLGSPKLILTCWVVAGLLSLIGALCTAELAAMMPGSGGEYVYFKRVYGKFFSFLYGWGNLTVMKSATIAALAYIFAESFNALIKLPDITIPALGTIGDNASIKMLATALIITLSWVNYRGVMFGERLSRFLIIGIIVVILGSVVAAFTSGHGSVANFSHDVHPPEGWQLLTAFFAASLSAFWGYEGWNNIGYIGEEIKNPQKNLPIALGLGTIAVILLYLVVNAVYLYVLPVEQLAAIHGMANQIAAVEVARILSGNAGAVILSVLILLTTFTCANSTILMSSRILFAMARDGLFISSTGKIHPVYQTPSKAIMWQCIWAIALLWSGNFDQLTDLLIFASFLFYGSTAVGVIVMRIKEPDTYRPYKTIGYPVLPALFALFCLTLVGVTIVQQPKQALTGLLLIFSGVPVYLYYIKKGRAISK
ncbi:amino acid permease [Mucilaginibacter sp. CSA2-8R]|uniref:APC family permease n=1 Tax=Mucilaginibacter sp. CSA2-8R TaxID=3141542 RepID=UPI00315CC305